MAEHSCNSPPERTINASHREGTESDQDKCSPIPSSCESRLGSSDADEGNKKSVSCNDGAPQLKVTICGGDQSVKAENTNGMPDPIGGRKTSSFLRPSALSGGSSTLLPSLDTPSTTRCPLKSPRLNLTPSKFGNLDGSSSSSPGTKLPFTQFKNPFANAVSFESEDVKNESFGTATKSNTLQKDGIGAIGDNKLTKPFTIFTKAKTSCAWGSANSSILTTNFVFGQNLHERVADGVATTNSSDSGTGGSSSGSSKDNAGDSANGNGTSDMLFTSVLSSKEIIKENVNNESGSGGREPFSLIEDAARCQEARANKRKYEEVLVTTGEEDEENILQVNVKLFAFDNGSWVERGRGTLRLNDKYCDGTVVSRIVIRTLGSLRVVLNAKIWRGMCLSRASERSIRLTAMDPNGQLKIFLIQASPKDMGTLYRYLDIRLKRCQESEEGGPDTKKKVEKQLSEGDAEENKT